VIGQELGRIAIIPFSFDELPLYFSCEIVEAYWEAVQPRNPTPSSRSFSSALAPAGTLSAPSQHVALS